MTTIYYNPNCSKCRTALGELNERGEDLTVINYLDGVVTEEMLRDALDKLGCPAIDIVRTDEKLWQEKFAQGNYNNEEIIKILLENPSLIQRPIVIKGNKAVIARPAERLKELFE